MDNDKNSGGAMRVLFLCSLNRWRSPTVEQIFAEHPGLECSSAGLNNGADNPLTPDLVEWAELIFVMERAHKTKLSSRFKDQRQARHLPGHSGQLPLYGPGARAVAQKQGDALPAGRLKPVCTCAAPR
jgi:predicted protein tyrosine phosphatase